MKVVRVKAREEFSICGKGAGARELVKYFF